MNSPYVSLTMTRQHVTELVRSPRATAALGPVWKQPARTAAPDLPEVSAPGTPVSAVPPAPTPALALQPDQGA